jgi:hypothetical protein
MAGGHGGTRRVRARRGPRRPAPVAAVEHRHRRMGNAAHRQRSPAHRARPRRHPGTTRTLAMNSRSGQTAAAPRSPRASSTRPDTSCSPPRPRRLRPSRPHRGHHHRDIANCSPRTGEAVGLGCGRLSSTPTGPHGVRTNPCLPRPTAGEPGRSSPSTTTSTGSLRPSRTTSTTKSCRPTGLPGLNHVGPVRHPRRPPRGQRRKRPRHARPGRSMWSGARRLS